MSITRQEVEDFFNEKKFADLSVETEDFTIRVSCNPKSISTWSRYYSLDGSKVRFYVKSRHLSWEKESELSRGMLKLSKATKQKVQLKVDSIYKKTEDAVALAKKIKYEQLNAFNTANSEFKKNFPNVDFEIKADRNHSVFTAYVSNQRICNFRIREGKIVDVSLLFKNDVSEVKDLILKKICEF